MSNLEVRWLREERRIRTDLANALRGATPELTERIDQKARVLAFAKAEEQLGLERKQRAEARAWLGI